MTAKQELMEYILSLTPEQLEKFLGHPEVIAILKDKGGDC